MQRRLPPYGRELAVHLQGDLGRWWGTSLDGKAAVIFLLCGSESWIIARRWHSHRLLLVAPPGEDAAFFNWSLLRGHDPVLIDRCGEASDDLVRQLAVAVLSAGVDRLLDLKTLDLHMRADV